MSKISEKIASQANAIRILRTEFTSRCQKNPRYSLRAFSRALGISHTVLSLVFSGKRPLSRKVSWTIVEKLNLDPATADIFTQGFSKPAPERKKFENYQAIELETFNVISDWVHFAILSLLETKKFTGDAKWLAKRLGINELHAKMCFQRLVDLAFVSEVEGVWRQTSKPIKVENKISTAATQNFHRQLLSKALESLENDPMEARDFSSITLALDPVDIPYAKERIRHFRRDLTAELEKKGRPKEVYNLTVQIYPVSKVESVL